MAYRRLMARVSGGSFTTVNSAGSQRASDRVSTEHAGSILAVLPIQGYSVWFLADFGHFLKREEKRRFVQELIRTGRATATRRRRQEAAQLAFHCAHRIDMRFCESLLHLVHGRRTSCVDRVPSASKKELSRPLEAVMDPT